MSGVSEKPKENILLHQWGKGRPGNDGYARCRACGARENTQESARRCPVSVADLGVGGYIYAIVCFFRDHQWMPMGGPNGAPAQLCRRCGRYELV